MLSTLGPLSVDLSHIRVDPSKRFKLESCNFQHATCCDSIDYSTYTSIMLSLARYMLSPLRRPSNCLSVTDGDVFGHVIVALASAAPELDSAPISKLTDDMRSFVFDGAVRSFRHTVTGVSVEDG